MRERALHLLFAGVFALVGALGSYAQTNATPEAASIVSCVVTDSSDAEARIPNAEVVFESDAGIVRTHTDDAGSLNTKLKSGKYNVTVRSVGFKTAQVIGFLVEAPAPKALNIRLAVGTVCDDCGGWISNAIPVHVDTADLPSKILATAVNPDRGASNEDFYRDVAIQN